MLHLPFSDLPFKKYPNLGQDRNPLAVKTDLGMRLGGSFGILINALWICQGRT